MCGRFVLTDPASALNALFGLDVPDGISTEPRYNVAPSQQVLAVRQPQAQREATTFHWGLIPSWAKDPKIAYRTINARSESAHQKPAFREAMKRRRCLVPTHGFFEWAELEGRPKRPYLVTVDDGEPFCFAGLWETWTPPDAEPIESCTILTTRPNAKLETLHDRMPVIVRPETFDRWLIEGTSAQDDPLFSPFDGDRMEFTPVSKLVNSPRNDDPRCIEPVVLDDEPEPPSTLTLPF